MSKSRNFLIYPRGIRTIQLASISLPYLVLHHGPRACKIIREYEIRTTVITVSCLRTAYLLLLVREHPQRTGQPCQLRRVRREAAELFQAHARKHGDSVRIERHIRPTNLAGRKVTSAKILGSDPHPFEKLEFVQMRSMGEVLDAPAGGVRRTH